MKMRKRVKHLLESSRNTYEKFKGLPDKEFVDGAAGKKMRLVECVARISTLQDLLNDERWDG